ncbi:hypothetical protein ACYQR9_19805 [Methylobacterium sp. CM6241]
MAAAARACRNRYAERRVIPVASFAARPVRGTSPDGSKTIRGGSFAMMPAGSGSPAKRGA